MSIPVVDIAEVLSRSEGLDGCDAVRELHSAFTTVGFVFIRNHGIDKKLVSTVTGYFASPKILYPYAKYPI